MLYNFLPIETTIAKIVRDNGLTESGFVAHFPAWIAEVVRNLCGTKQHIYQYHDVKLCFHKGKLPCNIRILDGASCGGLRLRYRDIESPVFGARIPGGDQVDVRYSFPTVKEDEPGVPNPTKYWNDLITMSYMDSDHWYSIEPGAPGHIISSLEDESIRLHYRSLALDKRGMVLVPDNQRAQDACAFYVRMMMIGSGRVDPVYGRDDRMLEMRYNTALDEARSQLDVNTPDMANGVGDAITRGFPPVGYSESFSTYISPETYL